MRLSDRVDAHSWLNTVGALPCQRLGLNGPIHSSNFGLFAKDVAIFQPQKIGPERVRANSEGMSHAGCVAET